jgi:hypothetical protein
MAVPGTPLRVSQYSQDRLTKYVDNIMNFQRLATNVRWNMLQQDRIYQRELDWTTEQLRAKSFNQAGDAAKMQNVTIPVVMPQVEATHGYLVDTFLSGHPVFPVVSGPDYEPVAQQMDAIMGEAATRFQYVRHLGMALRDGLKYNLMAVEVEWKNLKVYTVSSDMTKNVVFGVPVEDEYSGNIIKRIDPYNLIVDQRVALSTVHEKGDFVGYTEMMTYIQLKNYFLELDSTLTMNADEAFSSPSPVASTAASGDATQPYYVPQVNPNALRDPAMGGVNWLNWASLDDKNPAKKGDMYQITVMYLRIIPREMGINLGKDLGANGVPQIFKVVIVNQKVVIYVERKSNAHNLLPIIVGQPLEDGLNYQTKSFADNATPYQSLASALFNSAILSQRRKVYDRLIYDPSRIAKADIDRVDPVARIAVKQSAYGKPIGEAIEVMPYRDDGVPTILGMAREVAEMSDVSVGQNRVQRGQFQKGNKTLKEFDTVMDKADLRPRTMAVLIESGWMQPIKHVLKLNILQYQPPAQLFNQQTQAKVEIKPTELRTIAWQFQIADGVLPVSKLLNPELLGVFLQYSMAAAQQGQPMQYDVPGMVAYNMKLLGASWIDKFKLDPATVQKQQLEQTQMQRLANTPLQPPQGGAPVQ